MLILRLVDHIIQRRGRDADQPLFLNLQRGRQVFADTNRIGT